VQLEKKVKRECTRILGVEGQFGREVGFSVLDFVLRERLKN